MKTTKEDILLTSLHLFAESGFDAVSTGMIAEQLGITKGALYRHYKNKQEIPGLFCPIKTFCLTVLRVHANL